MFCVKFGPYCSYLDSGNHQLQTKPEKKSPIKSVNQKSILAENKDKEKHQMCVTGWIIIIAGFWVKLNAKPPEFVQILPSAHSVSLNLMVNC